ncbi:MAG: hypothetical protein JWO79_1264 [Actinomycetia bacterium]|nr:hypothetical protein [Actinomycetes bacterium]
MSALLNVLRALWHERYPQPPPWAAGLTSSRVIRQILSSVVSPAVEADRMRYELVPGDRDRVRTVLEQGGWATVAELGGLASDYAAAAAGYFATLPPGSRPDVANWRISEKACSDVGAAYLRFAASSGPALTDHLQQARERFQHAEVERAPRLRRLIKDVDVFAERFGAYYEEVWAGRDRAVHAALTPARLGLGSLERPALRGPAGWTVGTDRGVYVRYRHYASLRGARTREGVAQRKRLDPDRHMSVRLRAADPDLLAKTEVERAADPLGLRFAGHRALLDSLVRGFELADLRTHAAIRPGKVNRRVPLERWCAEMAQLPVTLNIPLVEAITPFAESWAARSGVALALSTAGSWQYSSLRADLSAGTGRTAARGRGEGMTDWVRQVELGVPRRLWGELLSCEQEWDWPLLPSEFPSLLKGTCSEHLKELIDRPIRDPVSSAQCADELTIIRATAGALWASLGEDGVQAMSEQVIHDVGGWRDHYDKLLHDHDPTAAPGHYLSAEAFREWLRATAGQDDRGDPETDPDDGGA